MTTSIRYLRMFLHSPEGAKNLIGYLSQYGDILRVSFNDEYVNDANRPTLSLGYRGRNEAATKSILTAPRDIRLTRSDGKWPAYFQNLLPEGHTATAWRPSVDVARTTSSSCWPPQATT